MTTTLVPRSQRDHFNLAMAAPGGLPGLGVTRRWLVKFLHRFAMSTDDFKSLLEMRQRYRLSLAHVAGLMRHYSIDQIDYGYSVREHLIAQPRAKSIGLVSLLNFADYFGMDDQDTDDLANTILDIHNEYSHSLGTFWVDQTLKRLVEVAKRVDTRCLETALAISAQHDWSNLIDEVYGCGDDAGYDWE